MKEQLAECLFNCTISVITDPSVCQNKRMFEFALVQGLWGNMWTVWTAAVHCVSIVQFSSVHYYCQWKGISNTLKVMVQSFRSIFFFNFKKVADVCSLWPLIVSAPLPSLPTLLILSFFVFFSGQVDMFYFQMYPSERPQRLGNSLNHNITQIFVWCCF